MKLTINENSNIQETEIIIHCAQMDGRMRHLVDYLRQYSYMLEGTIDGALYHVPLERVFYIDSVDKATFFYDKHRVYQHKSSLHELAKKLENAMFVRVSKNCVLNLSQLDSLRPHPNHKLEAILRNGERILVGRAYVDLLRQKLACYHAMPSPMNLPYVALGECPCGYETGERSVVNMGKILSFRFAPARVVALSYNAAEVLAALGLAERLVAIAPAESASHDMTPRYRPLLEKVPVLNRQDLGVPEGSTLRTVAADFALGSIHSLRALSMASPGENETYGFSLYVMEGSNPARATLESVYHDMMNLGRIFRVEDQALRLMEQCRKEVAFVRRMLPRVRPPRVFVYDSGKQTPCTAGGGTLESDLIALAGGQNVFADLPDGYTRVAWEEIAKADPECIIIHQYQDGLSAEDKIAFLQTLPALADTTAVRERRFVTVSLTEIFPGMQNAGAIEKLALAFHPGLSL